MNKFRILSALLFASLFAVSAQADETVLIKAGYASISPSGSFSGNIGGVGTTIDTKSLLLDRSNNVTAEVALLLGDGRLSASFLPLKFSGTSVSQGITFNGQTFGAGTPINSELKMDLVDVAFTYFVVNMDDLPSRFQLGIEASVKIAHANASITSAAITQTGSANVAIPTIGVRARVALADFIGVTARYGYLGYNGNTFSDLDAQIEFSPVPTLGIFGGYRSIDFKADSAGFVANAHFKGPFAGAFFRF